MVWLKAFISGFLATLIFHQGLFAVLHAVGVVPMPAYNLGGVPPLGVPAVISSAFFGGLWGMALWAAVRKLPTVAFWVTAVAFGAIGPTVVAMLVVFPMKGIAVSGAMWILGMILNGFWGLGTALLMLVMGERRSRARHPEASVR
ncbi:hypothetical protein [Allohahella sp. A8]|uniref:hypothetical protein n=1 Tax=Allohahella sp. A8 TaxID=3141461 RepID=UPI000C0B62D1|nr:hypothetical protein [Hahellaceae bacterium]|tara:strand:- start:19147 stop:19581 length:435 start_codon:yes stop_codon:yes gene_type:complete